MEEGGIYQANPNPISDGGVYPSYEGDWSDDSADGELALSKLTSNIPTTGNAAELFMKLHWKCELHERLINEGKDPTRLHPAMSVKGVNNEYDPQHTPYTMDLLHEYRMVTPTQEVPLFWPRRPYDDPSTFLNERETESLTKRIQETSRVPAYDELTGGVRRPQQKQQPERKQQNNKRHEKAMYTVKLLDLYFETDISSEATDFW